MMCCNSCVISDDDDDDDVDSLQTKAQDIPHKTGETKEVTTSPDIRATIPTEEHKNSSETTPKEKVKVDSKQEVGLEEVQLQKKVSPLQTIPERLEKLPVKEQEVQTTEKVFGIMSASELQSAVNRLEAVASRLETLAQKSSSAGSSKSSSGGGESGNE